MNQLPIREDFLAALGRRLKAARKQAGYTQMEVGKQLGQRFTLSKYESGAWEMGIWRLLQLCNLYRVSLLAVAGLEQSAGDRIIAAEEQLSNAISQMLQSGPEYRMNCATFLFQYSVADGRLCVSYHDGRFTSIRNVRPNVLQALSITDIREIFGELESELIRKYKAWQEQSAYYGEFVLINRNGKILFRQGLAPEEVISDPVKILSIIEAANIMGAQVRLVGFSSENSSSE